MKTLLKNGTIIDGSQSRPYQSDLLIENQTISQIDKNINCVVDDVIDCSNMNICPGFIDAHSHNDFFYDYPNAKDYYQPFIEQGITTQITGNCGFSPFGISKKSKYISKVNESLFYVKNPGSFENFILETQKNRLYLNIVPLIGQGTTRVSVKGYDPTPLNSDELKQEMYLVEEAMENGAWGGSFGFMYEPGMYNTRNENILFAKTLAKYDGILTVHPRACSVIANDYPILTRKPHIELGLEEVIDIMKEAKVRTEYSHLIFVGEKSWKSVDTMLNKFHQCRKDGFEIGYDFYSMTYGASVITVILPAWYMALSKEKRKSFLNKIKIKILAFAAKNLLGFGYADFKIAYISPNHKKYEGLTVEEAAKLENKRPANMYLDLVDYSDGKGRLYLDKYYNEKIIEQLMKDDLSIFMTDAWYEENGTQNAATYQCYPNFLLKGKKYNIPIQTVIRKMTGATADRYKIKQRGYLKTGYIADITIFDGDKLSVNIDIPDYKPKGIEYVFINGQKVVDKNIFSDKRVGELILKR